MTATKSTIKIIGASAGTGKTTRLASEFLSAIDGITRPSISADRILVSSFTTKASAELITRIRQRLIQSGNFPAAQLVLSGYVGTVNSICSKILSDNALSAGLSPVQNVIPDDLERVIFSIAADEVFDSYSGTLDELAVRLSFDEPPRKTKFATSVHWTEFVKQICHYARSNGISPDMLPSFAEDSWHSMKVYLRQPKAGVTAAELDAKLLKELERSVSSLKRANDSTKKTQDTLTKLEEILARSKRKPLTWADWAVLAGTDVSKASSIMILGLVNTSNDHPAHPGLHADLEKFILSIFECAAEALTVYQDYKTNAGLIDFADQEQKVLELLDHPDVKKSLRSKIELAFIDEFQDTSPLQLALFLKIADLVAESVWVGDPKQAIYGFRGTDPALMESAIKNFSLESPEQLKKSYRSKKSLVDFSNNVFKQAFSAFGHDPETVTSEPTRADSTDETPSIQVWKCDGSKLEFCFNSLAKAVTELLEQCPPLQIYDKKMSSTRSLVGSDIAILCRSNDRCQGVAEALSEQGLKVATTRDGLLDTPECLLAVGMMRYLIDRSDRFALALITHLDNDYTKRNQANWLTDWLSESENPEKLFLHAAEIDKARSRILPNCTALEALQAALSAGHVLETVYSWGDIQQRTANLDALRGLVIEYENACSLERSAASAAGFIGFVNRLKNSKQPPSAAVDAIQVLTYHGSKGLEWPVVILTDLDKGSKPEIHKDVCRVEVESTTTEFSLSNPLQGRWIRFWPWPYGRQEQNVYLDSSMLKSTEYETTVRRLKAESVRLLYVGVTRARDLLIVAPYVNRRGQGSGVEWLNHLEDQNKRPVLRLPVEDGLASMSIADTNHPVLMRTIASDSSSTTSNSARVQDAVFLSSNRLTRDFLPLLLKPSEATSSLELDPSTLTVIDLGSRIPLTGNPDMQLVGDCIHRFLAADLPHLSHSERCEVGDRLRMLWAVNNVTTESMIEMSDRFKKHIFTMFGECRWYRECPIKGRLGNQRISGVIDLILETENDFVIYDHKSFPGNSESWATKAATFAGQLKMYAQVLSQAADKPVLRAFIHMPVVGKVIDLSPSISTNYDTI
ncbi:UvrD-helicase domain-containing protein [soil metagenome]